MSGSGGSGGRPGGDPGGEGRDGGEGGGEAAGPERVALSEGEWRERLGPARYHVMREKGTEPPFTGKHLALKADGTYRCAACGRPLFDADAKYESGTGWPSFFQPAEPDAVRTEPDTSHGIRRTEVLCARCGSHLGHLFEDGPEPTGLRYCINSIALEMAPDD